MDKYEYRNIEEAKPGDIVEHQGKARKDIFGSDKKLCIVTKVKDNAIYTNVKPDEWFYKEYFKLVKTRPGTEAKVGNTVICIKKSINYTEGDVYHITDREDLSTIVMLKDSNHTTCSSSSVYFRVLCRTEPESKTLLSASGQSLAEIHKHYSTGGLVEYRLPGQTEWCSYNNDKNRPSLDTEQATEYEFLIQPTEKRNLAFYKRSGEPWTNEELSKIQKYCDDRICEATGKQLSREYVFDDGFDTSFMFPWRNQEEDYNFKNCKQVAYEDVFKTPHPEETSPATPCSLPTPTIPEEELMNPIKENITIAMTADEYAKYEKSNKTAKLKTDLESASKWITIWYNPAGVAQNQTTESPKKARKALQRPNRLGYTFRSYKITTSATTDIPVANVDI